MKISNKLPLRLKPLLIVISIVASIVLPVLVSLPVRADGETYRWQDAFKIAVTGGGLEDTTLTTQTSHVPGTPELFSGQYKDTTHGGCVMGITMTLLSPSSGKITFVNNHQTFISAAGTTPPVNCSDSVASAYLNKTVSISGTRPTPGETAETQAQKTVSITIRYNGAAAQAPANVTFTITGAGNFNRAVTLNKDGTDDISYTGSTTLEPGDYTGTASALVSGPQHFTKVKFQSLDLTYGEFNSDRLINVTVQMHMLGGAPEHQGPIQLALKKPDGTVVATTQTEAKDNPHVDTGLAPAVNIETTVYAYGTFTNVDKGTYKVCVVSANKCVDVTKGDGAASVTIDLSNTESTAALAEATTPTPQEEDDSCENKGGLLSYVFCPLIRMFDSAIDKLDKEINGLLYVPENNLQDGTLVQSARQIRNLAYFILVPIMLVMVVGTALGFEFVSAYTVKRALPRLVFAVIFIALSWPITSFIIGIVNVLGVGISGLLLNPFFQGGGGQSGLANILNPGQAAGTGGAVIFAGGAAVLALGWALIGILLSYAFVAFVVMLIGFAILAIRQVLILVLALMAPLAILAWIFPGNDKIWKIWWGSFTKLLLMYPLIELLIGGGKVFAQVTSSAQQGGLGLLITITAYLAPYFFIPATFKWAGGAFAAVSGMVNNRSKGLFDRQRAARGKMAGDAFKEFKAGRETNSLRGMASRSVGRRIGAGYKGRYGFGKGGRAGIEASTAALGAEMAEGSQIWQANKNNDKFMTAHANESVARKRQAEARRTGDETSVRAWEQAIQASRLVPKTKASRLAAAQSWSASGYNLADGKEGYHELAQTMAEITGNTYDATTGTASGTNMGSYANAMNNAQYNLKNAGRFDLAGINDGAGYKFEGGIDKANGFQAGTSKTNTFNTAVEEYLGDGFRYAPGTVNSEGKDIGGKIKEGNDFADQLVKGVASNKIKAEDVGKLHAFLSDSYQSATGGNKKFIGDKLRALEGLSGGPLPATQNMAEAVALIQRNNRELRRGVDPNILNNPDNQ